MAAILRYVRILRTELEIWEGLVIWNLVMGMSENLSNIYSESQKWEHPSYFCRYLSISLHGTTLAKWYFDTMKSSLCAAYIT